MVASSTKAECLWMAIARNSRKTAWGWVPNQSAVTYAFNTASDSRRLQDIGFNGLTSEEERTFGPYAKFLEDVRSRVRPEVYDSLVTKSFSRPLSLLPRYGL